MKRALSHSIVCLSVLLIASCATSTTSAPAQPSTPEPTATQTPIPTLTITPEPTQVGGGSGRLIFELEKAEFAKRFPDLKGDLNVFAANADGTDLVPITTGLRGYNSIESISPDGTKVLIASASDKNFETDKSQKLYSIDLNSLESEPVELASGLAQDGWKGSIAKWIDNNRIVYIGQGEIGFGIYTVNSDGTDSANIYKYNNDGAAHRPTDILAVDGTRAYWDSAVTTSLGGNRSNTKNFAWWSSMDGSEQGPLEFNGNQIVFDYYFNPLVFTANGTELAWVEPATATFHHNYLHIATISAMDKANQLDILSSFPILRWWPDGSKILIFDQNSIRMQEVQKLDATSDLFGLFTVSISSSLLVRNEHLSDVLDILVPPDSRGYGSYCLTGLDDFSPDGRQILVSLPDHVSSGRCISKESLLNLETMTFSAVLPGMAPRNVKWLPEK